MRFEVSPRIIWYFTALHDFKCPFSAAIDKRHPSYVCISYSHGVYVTSIKTVSPNAQFFPFGYCHFIFKVTRSSLVNNSFTTSQPDCCTTLLECGCCCIVVFFTLTDRASTIPSNIRGCQSGTWSQRGTGQRVTSW